MQQIKKTTYNNLELAATAIRRETMFDLTNPSIIPANGSGLDFVNGNQPSLSDIDRDLFPKGFFSQVVYDYFDVEWGEGYDEEDTVAQWLKDHDDDCWFDIKKDEHGDYYYVAGDQSGIVYYEQIFAIKVICDNYEVRINEDSSYYYISFLDKEYEYDKEDWTLEDAIFDLERVLENSL